MADHGAPLDGGRNRGTEGCLIQSLIPAQGALRDMDRGPALTKSEAGAEPPVRQIRGHPPEGDHDHIRADTVRLMQGDQVIVVAAKGSGFRQRICQAASSPRSELAALSTMRTRTRSPTCAWGASTKTEWR